MNCCIIFFNKIVIIEFLFYNIKVGKPCKSIFGF